MFDLTVSFHKGTCASSHLGHNRRSIHVPHSDPARKHLNVCYIDMSVEEAYHHLFDTALKEYNHGKKPSRQINDYYQHIMEQYQRGQKKLQQAISTGASKAEQRRIKSKHPNPYYEVIISIGNRDCYDGAFSAVGQYAETTSEILSRYMEDFQKRNPNLFVFSAFLHRDEPNGVNHIHCAYIPWTDLPGRGLPIRVSENGAFIQQGLTTGKLGDYGTIKFQEQERAALTEIAKKYDINIVAGRHSKKHLSKEEYILRQEQEKSRADAEHIDQEAGILLEEQDRFIEFVQTSDQAKSYFEHIENEALRQTVSEFEAIKQRNDRLIADAWQEFNSATSSYFQEYRAKKKSLYEAIHRARQGAKDSQKCLNAILNDISYSNDLIIIKMFKLVFALFVAIESATREQEVKRLQEKNQQIKALAKNIVTESQIVGEHLRNKDIGNIERILSEYERLLHNALIAIDSQYCLLPNNRTEQRPYEEIL